MVDLNIAADQAINEVVQLLIQDMGKTSINYKFSPNKKGEIDRVVYPNLNSSKVTLFPSSFHLSATSFPNDTLTFYKQGQMRILHNLGSQIAMLNFGDWQDNY